MEAMEYQRLPGEDEGRQHALADAVLQAQVSCVCVCVCVCALT